MNETNQKTLTGGEAQRVDCKMYGGGWCGNVAEYKVTIPPSYEADRIKQVVCGVCLDELRDGDNVEECRELSGYERHEPSSYACKHE